METRLIIGIILSFLANLVFAGNDHFSTLLFRNHSDSAISVYITTHDGRFKDDVFDGSIAAKTTKSIRLNKPKKNEIYEIYYVISIDTLEVRKRSRYIEDTIVLDYDSFSLYHIRQDNELKYNVVQEMLDINLYNEKSLKYQDSVYIMNDNKYVQKAIQVIDSIKFPMIRMLYKKPQNYFSVSYIEGIYQRVPIDSMNKYMLSLDSNLFGHFNVYKDVKKNILYQLNTYEVGSTVKRHEMYNIKYLKDTLPIVDSAEEVLAFWFMACTNCYRDFDSLYQYTQQKPFPKIIAVGTDIEYKRWIDGIEKHHIKWDNYSDLKGRFSELYTRLKIETMPLYVYIGKGRKILKIAKTSQELISFYNINH
jgi:hypothetical protein